MILLCPFILYTTNAIGDITTDCSSAIHPGGLGTIMVGSTRFGGTPINTTTVNDDVADKRQITSAYFILNITNPEAEPTLLTEMTRTTAVDTNGDDFYADLGYSPPSPTMVVMQSIDNLGEKSTKWYLVLGNGPTTVKGENDQQGKLVQDSQSCPCRLRR